MMGRVASARGEGGGGAVANEASSAGRVALVEKVGRFV